MSSHNVQWTSWSQSLTFPKSWPHHSRYPASLWCFCHCAQGGQELASAHLLRQENPGMEYNTVERNKNLIFIFLVNIGNAVVRYHERSHSRIGLRRFYGNSRDFLQVLALFFKVYLNKQCLQVSSPQSTLYKLAQGGYYANEKWRSVTPTKSA